MFESNSSALTSVFSVCVSITFGSGTFAGFGRDIGRNLNGSNWNFDFICQLNIKQIKHNHWQYCVNEPNKLILSYSLFDLNSSCNSDIPSWISTWALENNLTFYTQLKHLWIPDYFVTKNVLYFLNYFAVHLYVQANKSKAIFSLLISVINFTSKILWQWSIRQAKW